MSFSEPRHHTLEKRFGQPSDYNQSGPSEEAHAATIRIQRRGEPSSLGLPHRRLKHLVRRTPDNPSFNINLRSRHALSPLLSLNISLVGLTEIPGPMSATDKA